MINCEELGYSILNCAKSLINQVIKLFLPLATCLNINNLCTHCQMRNCITTALMASIAFAKLLEEELKAEAKTKTANFSKWPDDWTNASGPIWPAYVQIAEYDQTMKYWLERCDSIYHCKPARGYCRMQYNPAYPTTFPHGELHLVQFGPWSPVFIYGNMTQLPYPNSKYGFSINERNWDYKDCRSSGNHLQQPGQTHGLD